MIELLILIQVITPSTQIEMSLFQIIAMLIGVIGYTGTGVAGFYKLTSKINTNALEIEGIKLSNREDVKELHECREREDEKTSQIFEILRNQSAMLLELKGDIRAHNSYHDGINREEV